MAICGRATKCAASDLVKTKWQTHIKAQTGATGEIATRGYLGDYTVELPFTLRQNSQPLIVTLP